MRNVDADVRDGFGREWSTFTQGRSDLKDEEREQIFNQYFRLFPWNILSPTAEGLDAGCGTGRWAMLVAPRVGHLHLLDASPAALTVARQNLSDARNVTFHLASVSDIPLRDNSLDFAYSLGVLHHVPDTLGAIKHIAAKLKPRSPFLIYLYYALDNRPIWFRAIWRTTNVARLVISGFPNRLKSVTSGLIAAMIYWPIGRFCRLLGVLGIPTRSIPLEFYKDRSFYTMRTDAYDRFCTSLEKRFTRIEIERLLGAAGFEQIDFSDQMPFWCAVARKGE